MMTMNPMIQAFLPYISMATTIIVLMLFIAIKRHPWWNPAFAVAGLNITLATLYPALKVVPRAVTPLFLIDGTSIFFMGLTLFTTLACLTLTHAYIERFKKNREEIYLLMLTASLGGMVMVSAINLTSLFIGLETLSLSFYGLVGYTYTKNRTLEASIKYMVLSAASTGFMLFGMALLYAEFGELGFTQMQFQTQPQHADIYLTVAASLLLLVGFSFKLSLVPFHMWTPDVYEGAPAPVGAFLATTSKVAVMAVLLRLLVATHAMHSGPMLMALSAMAVASMLVGNLLALKQNNLKRMLGYSSIAHFGYMMVGLLMFARQPMQAFIIVGMYLVVYSVTAIGSFGVIALMSRADELRDADSAQDYRGLFWRRPLLTSVFTVTLLSLGGVPFTAGFIGKFYIAMGAIMSQQFYMLIALLLGSAIGIYFYLRTMVTLFMQLPGMRGFDADMHWGEHAGGLMVLGVVLLVLLIGVYPHPLMQLMMLTFSAHG